MYNAQAGRVLSTPRQLIPVASFSILMLLILGCLLYILLNRPERPVDPATAFAAAFDGLSEVESVHFSVEVNSTGGTGTFRFTNLGVLDIEISEHYFPADWDAFEQQTEEDCLERDGDYRYCIIRKRGTGEEVGRIERGYSMRTTSEGALVLPGSVHYTQSWKPDRPLQLSAALGVDPVERPALEFVYVDGVTWAKTVGGDPYWHMSNTDGSLGPIALDLFRWGLLDAPGKERPNFSDRYDSVERLQDTELDGIPVRRYMASRGEGNVVLEIWVGKQDGLVRRTDKRLNLGSGSDAISSERTYTFSRFNEPVEIPRPWPCFGAPGC